MTEAVTAIALLIIMFMVLGYCGPNTCFKKPKPKGIKKPTPPPRPPHKKDE